MNKAFQGTNGWYAAWEDENGFHHQPADGGTLSRTAALREARELNSADPDPEDEQRERDDLLRQAYG
jgi:hypothetical protein